MRLCILIAALLLPGLAPCAGASTTAGAVDQGHRAWIGAMKESERGPFSRIRWFCRDGSVLPPSSPCRGHGGGFQHGEWSERTKTLRAEGYYIANILAGTDAVALANRADFSDRFAQLLIERYLVGADDGWILRRALFYRGAIQEEDERAAARDLLLELAGRDEWVGFRFPALRAGAALLAHGESSASVQKVRQDSASLSGRDAGFKPLRAKIHGAPGPEDADAVRRYAAGLEDGQRRPYLALADEIDALYQVAPLRLALNETAAQLDGVPWLQQQLRATAARLRLAGSPERAFELTAALLLELRDVLPTVTGASLRLDLVDLGLRLELEHFRAAVTLREALPTLSRRQQARLLASSLRAAYGGGLISRRLLNAALDELSVLDQSAVGLDRYQAALAYLGRAPGWGTQTMRMLFFDSMQKLARLEPLAMLFIQDQLRGSPLLFFAQVLDGLSRDANRLAGVTHRVFGEEVGTGFFALNPGLARGVLQVEPDLSDPASFRPDGIYVLPETVADLPPVAGILTAGEGNPLSHIQLLARNLGIPNVTVSTDSIPALAAHDGADVVFAVSRSGLVEIDAWGGRWGGAFEAGPDEAVLIRPDLGKLDLAVRRFVPLAALRADDSGRTVGPKAAKLGELRYHYPEFVSRGLAISFGLFRQEALERQRPGHAGSVWDWMTASYAMLESLPEGSPQRAEATEAFRSELYDTILATPLDEDFRAGLKAALREAFGGDEPPGLFVRSDTNVEDLAGFTGAGLNLTLPNVVGFDELVAAIPRVWASPFTARAFRWRQSHMAEPEHVYTSILLLESVASDKSGVLVTRDIDSGDPGVLSVAVNEGIGGAVDGQAAESLRIDLESGEVRVLATATAPRRRVLGAEGGLETRAATGRDEVLEPAEIGQLIEFARGLPERFPPILDEEGEPAPADVEFGFIDGQLRLFQLRPFLDSRSAAGNAYLREMDARLVDVASVVVDMEARP